MNKQPGWQQPPIRLVRKPMQCPHLSLLTAVFTIHRHPEGHEWVCTCGQVFVVVSGTEGKKKLVPR